MESQKLIKIESEFTVDNDELIVVDEIQARTDLSKIKIKGAMNKGAVWITHKKKTTRVRRAKARAKPGDAIAIYYDEKILNTEPPEPVLIADKDQYSVRHKPAGLMSSGTRYGDHCAINRWIERSEDRPTFLVHRLDQFASGLMVIAHTKKAAAHLSKQFQERQTTKIYKVIVDSSSKSAPEPASEPSPEFPQDSKFTINESLDGKEAISHVTTLETRDGLSLLEVKIETGRKHQIRRHLASAGLPVLGDRQYGENQFPELQLTAVELGFTCPVNNQFVTFLLPEEYHPQLSAVNTRNSDHVT